jgi:hypothetical protein
MKYLLVLISVLVINGCATNQPRPILECKMLCTGEKVEVFKDETLECRCQVKQVEVK